MELTLTIDNETALADGGPLTYGVKGRRSFDIGRASHLDWTLPDPSRFISSKHCEVRYRDNAYWLHDVSTNGTFLNGSERRMSEPHRLRDGDLIAIGHYLVKVELVELVEAAERAREASGPEAPADASGGPLTDDSAGRLAPPRGDLWSGADNLPHNAADKRVSDPHGAGRSGQAAGAPVAGDFLDWAADLQPLIQNVPATRPQRIASPAVASTPPREPPPAAEVADWSPEPAPTRQRDSDASSPAHGQPMAGEPSDGWWDAPAGAAAQVRVASAARAGVAAPEQAAAPAFHDAPAAQDPPPSVHVAVVAQALAPMPAQAAATSVTKHERAFMRAFAEASGIPETMLQHHDDASLAALLGGLMRLTVEDLKQLLAARFEAKRMARSSQQTQIAGLDNNPLKFTPTVDDALALMFGPPSQGYLDASRTLQASFDDIKTHQLETYAAMQSAILDLTDDFDPKKIDASIGRDGGLGNLVASRKARAWDIFVARWEAKTLRRDNGILGAFMEYFSKNYDRGK